jgi:3-oxoacid CoA-transferase
VSTRSVLAQPELVEDLRPEPVATIAISQHTPIGEVRAAAERVRESGADSLVSVGGGSAVDAAKLIGIIAGRGAALPHVAVPTTLSVAELASGAGFTDEDGDKAGRGDPRMLPGAVIYDARLAVRTPIELWLSTGVRALDHAVEGYLANGANPFSDVLCLEAVRRLFRTLPLARDRPNDPAIRTENQIAAWLSYPLPEAAGGLSHVMGKQIGARHGIPHGFTSCLLLPHVMRYRASRQPERMAELSRATGAGGGPLAAADDVEALIEGLGLRRTLAAWGVEEPDLRRAVDALAGEHSADDLLDIYRQAG